MQPGCNEETPTGLKFSARWLATADGQARINQQRGAFSLGLACKGATAAVVLEYSKESVLGECNVKHNTPELTNLSERTKILESTLESATELNCS